MQSNLSTARITALGSFLALAILAASCGTPEPRETLSSEASSAQSTMSSDDQVAQSLAERLIARGRGKAEKAVYVRTTQVMFAAAEPTGAESDSVRPTDSLLVVKVVGLFQPEHSRPIGVTPPPTTVLMTVYNLRTSQVIQNSFFSGDTSDVTGGASALAGGRPQYDLRRMGTARVIPI
jgi:hypothetical protein